MENCKLNIVPFFFVLSLFICPMICHATDNPLFPMHEGYEWQYEVQASGGACQSGHYTASVTGTATFAGYPSYQWQSYCSYPIESTFAIEGDEVDLLFDGAKYKILYSGMKDGDQWTDSSGSNIEAHFVAAVAVPAGTFANCWTIHLVNMYTDVQNSYCPGVGLTKVVQTDGTNTLEANLVSKNF